MLAKDVSQQAAELRQAFLRHLPRRVDLLQKKGHRLIRGPWDVNAAALLLKEVQQLAGAAGKHGLVDSSDRLYQLELRLAEDLKQAMRDIIEAEERLNYERRMGDKWVSDLKVPHRMTMNRNE